MKKRDGLIRALTALLFLFCFLPSVHGATIDVMIVYDTTAKSWVSGRGGMNAFAADAVARMNQAMTNSNVDLTFRLVHAADVAYTYSGDLSADLTSLQTGAGGLSIVHEWRDAYAADVVAMLVDTGSASGTVGTGYLLTSYSGEPDYAFSTNAIRSVDISHTLTHEIGHNLGCHHSKNQKSSPGPNYWLNSYSAGWYFTGTDATAYHTIMAYNSDGYGHFYVEAPLFSIPLLTYRGTAAGDSQDGDNARNIRETMDIVAAYYTPFHFLYFPHVDTSLPWQTEIAVINTSPTRSATGTLRALGNEGQLIETKAVTLPARGRRQITIADEFTRHTDIGYIVFETDATEVQGYTKFYQAGIYRAAIPAVREVNTSDIHISHIDPSAQWWTGLSLVNTTLTRKDLTIVFNNGQSVPYTLTAKQHKTFTIASLFNNQPRPDIQSAVITNASGVIGLELFGSIVGGNQMDGILLTDNTASPLYYPHVAGDNWWTGIVAYNPSESACTITITPYSVQGTPLSTLTRPLAGKEKYIGLVSELGLPDQTAWFKIDSTRPLTGFELFGSADGSRVAAYAGGGGTGTMEGVFPKIEKNGWTGIAFVNTEDSTASVTLTAYKDDGSVVATQALFVGGHAKVVNLADAIFSQDIRSATYIAYSSDRNVVGFQLNGTSDGIMLDGLPGLGAGTLGVTAPP